MSSSIPSSRPHPSTEQCSNYAPLSSSHRMPQLPLFHPASSTSGHLALQTQAVSSSGEKPLSPSAFVAPLHIADVSCSHASIAYHQSTAPNTSGDLFPVPRGSDYLLRPTSSSHCPPRSFSHSSPPSWHPLQQSNPLLLHAVNAPDMFSYPKMPPQLVPSQFSSSASSCPQNSHPATTLLPPPPAFAQSTACSSTFNANELHQTAHAPRSSSADASLRASEPALDSPRLRHSRDDAPLISVFVSGLWVCALMSCSLYFFQYGCQMLHTHAPLEPMLKYLEFMCPATSIMLYISPAMTVVRSAMEGKHQTLPVKMFLVQGVSNVLAVDYGLKVKQPAIYLTNCAGLLIQLLWLGVYNYICLTNSRRVAPSVAEVLSTSTATKASRPDGTATATTPSRRISSKNAFKGRLHSILSSRFRRQAGLRSLLVSLSIGSDGKGWFAFLMTCACCISGLLYSSSLLGAETVGIACTISNLMLFSVPLSSLGTMIRSRNSDSLPLAMLLMMVLCSAAWGVYGYLLKDAVVYVPSLIGYLMALFQLIIVLWCRGVLPKQIDLAALFSVMFNTRRSHSSRDNQKISWTNSEHYYDCNPNTTPQALVDVALNSAHQWNGSSRIVGQSPINNKAAALRPQRSNSSGTLCV
eukprot:GHVS01067391.1.p1 GENE.GHVS01067391.1~~GHVS01067391.1.p1  ORF type:complete len:638 (+),score=68.35 GHVS01067391.1:308-2221(+)